MSYPSPTGNPARECEEKERGFPTRPVNPSPDSLTMNTKPNPFLKHKWKFVLITSVFWAAAAVYYFLTIPPYVSEAKLVVRYVIDVGEDGKPLPGDGPAVRDPIVNWEIEVLTSRSLAEEVVKEVGAARLEEGSDAKDPLSVVTGGLMVSKEKDSTIIHVAFQHANARTAQETLKALVDLYFQRHLAIHRMASTAERTRNELFESFALFSSTAVFCAREGDKFLRMPNIDMVQGPTRGVQETKTRDQILMAMIAGGPALGLLVVMLLGMREKRAAVSSMRQESME
jgi:capsular polysaccharide biosynthesis protein